MAIILGVDPGTLIMGFSVISTTNRKIELLTLGVEKMQKLSDAYAKLHCIFGKITQLVEEFHPDVLAIESPYSGKNAQSMLKLARAQGVVIAAALQGGLEVYEFSPRKIKQSITGNGNAAKEQVAAMLCYMKIISESTHYMDATDALAAAVCYHLESTQGFNPRKTSNWDAFLMANKDRIIK